MEDKKLLLYYNTAPHYRAAIFRKIDEEYDCDWYFGETKTDIKEMDRSLLKSVTMYRSFGNPSKLYWTCSLIPLLFNRKYQTFFILAESRSVSCWVFLFLAHLFFPKKKIYDWGHGWYGKEKRLQVTLKKWMCHRFTGIFVYGDYAKQLMIKEGVSGDKIFVIKNSLDYERQVLLRNAIQPSSVYREHFVNGHPTILFIGRLTKVKRLDLLFRAIKLLKERDCLYNVALVGDGAEKMFLERFAGDEKLSDQVWFYGSSYDEAVNSMLIYNADLCVSPGNVGLTAMHSLVFGTPVITHNNFSLQMPEFESITPDVTGDFYEYGCVESLADTIQKWFENHKGRRDEVRRACFKEIDTYWNPDYQMDVIRQNLKF